MTTRMNFQMTTRTGTALALVCILLTAACSEGGGLTEPTSLRGNGPQAWSTTTSGTTTSVDDSWDYEVLNTDSGDTDWELVLSGLTWTMPEASAVIGRSGGTVTLWAISPYDFWQPYHSITVPAGAVNKPTRFTITVGSHPAIDVHLSATEVSSGRRITEFRTPVTLSLTYAGSSVEDPSRLAIVYMVDGVVSEVVESTLDAEHHLIISELSHFSRYAVATE